MNRLTSEIRNILLGISFGFLGLFVFSTPALAANCTNSFDARQIASSYADSIMEELGGFGFGRQVNAHIMSCQYYPSRSAVVMDLRVSWVGMNGEVYWGNGEFFLTSESWRWITKNANGNLMSLWFQRGVLEEMMEQ